MALTGLCSEIARAFAAEEPDGEADLAGALVAEGQGALPSWFAVSDLAFATIGMAGLTLARLARGDGSDVPAIAIDQRLATIWFATTIQPIDWQLPGIWDDIAGDYRAQDGWIRLHTNALKHRAAALGVLGCAADKPEVGQTVSGWKADALESAVVEAGGCAAVMRSVEDWAVHPQGRAVAGEPLVIWQRNGEVEPDPPIVDSTSPLAGLRVLDLTRILAGPVASRFLAGYGADVLRIDPPGWDEPAAAPEVTLGKRCAGLDLTQDADRAVFDTLLGGADVLLHGYRPGALEALGYGPAERREKNPGLIDVCLDAYGWSGPWAGRRGFDSLVQMSSGIAAYGMAREGGGKPFPLPVQALDHGTGCLLAAAVLHALRRRRSDGTVLSARLSLARTAHLLSATAGVAKHGTKPTLGEADLEVGLEQTAWGPARRARFPLRFDGIAPEWRYPASRLRSAAAAWLA